MSEQIVVPGRRLGKHAPKVDARTLKMAKYVDPSVLALAPEEYDASVKVTLPWGVMGNDVHGDCTCAALGHHVQVWTANNGKQRTPTDAEVLELYGKVNGGQDSGANMLDVLNHFTAEGLGGFDRPSAFVSVDRRNPAMVRAAAYLFGGLYIGLNLPLSAQAQDVWDYLPDSPLNAAGSWGGHAVASHLKYEAGGDRFWLVTWGQWKECTKAFLDAYCDEMYAILDPDWLDSTTGKSPMGFDVAALQDDLQTLGA